MPRRKAPQKIDNACVFCRRVDVHPLLGSLVEKNGLRMHSNCIFAASGLSQAVDVDQLSEDHVDGFPLSAILVEVKRGRCLKCSACHKPGACVGCAINSCQTSFHLPCLIRARGVTIFEDPFPSYCRRHAPKQDFHSWLKQCKEPPSCCICLFTILPDINTDSSYTESRKTVNAKVRDYSKENIPVTVERRRPRRSCVALSTPKRIRVSDGMSSVRKFSLCDTSLWELPGSSPEHEIENQIEVLPKLPLGDLNSLPPSMRGLPTWLSECFLQINPDKRVSAYEVWSHNTIHGLCCPLAWMHRDCIAGFAVSAALHYIKCPYCANKQTFIHSIIQAGIWVPDRDAAWELEPGAFADLVPVNECSSISDSNDDESRGSSTPSVPVIQSECVQSNDKVNEVNNEHICQNSRNQLESDSSDTSSPSTDPENNTVLSLIWNNRQLSTRRQIRKPRRYTQATQVLPTQSNPMRISRRQTCTVTRSMHNEHSICVSGESRLRQVTLGSFLSLKTQTSN